MNKSNLIKKIKKAQSKKKIENTIILLKQLYDLEPEKIKDNLVLANFFFEPLATKIKREDFDFLKEITTNLLSEENTAYRGLKYILVQVIEVSDILLTVSIPNSNMLSENKFISENKLPQQIQALIGYIEDQQRLIKENNKFQSEEYISGMESYIPMDSSNSAGVKVSEKMNYDVSLEIFELIVEYLYYKYQDELESEISFYYKDINPYNNKDFAELLCIGQERHLLTQIWDEFKYGGYLLDIDEQNNLIFRPKNLKNHILKKIGNARKIYSENSSLIFATSKNRAHLNKLLNKTTESIEDKNIYNFKDMDRKEFHNLSEFNKFLFNEMKSQIDTIYYKIEYDGGISFTELSLGIEYLMGVAHLQKNYIEKNFSGKNYELLAPIIDIQLLIDGFEKFYNISKEKSELIMKKFIFYPKTKFDVFSTPLIYVGCNKICFSPSFVLNANWIRFFEEFGKSDLTSQKGLIFEKEIRFLMSFNPYIQVNNNEIKFYAHDGKRVEFDFLGKFEDHLLLFEFKHIAQPYDPPQFFYALDTIETAVEQVNRRVGVIKEDWGKIRELCSFELPETPPSEDKIIKIVCTNIRDFTMRKINNVLVIDPTILINFFTYPETEIKYGDYLENTIKKTHFKNKVSSLSEFKQYLENPHNITFYKGAFNKQFLKLPIKEKNIFMESYFLAEDPYKNLFKNLFENLDKLRNIKDNNFCFCNSGKKFKKCCKSKFENFKFI